MSTREELVQPEDKNAELNAEFDAWRKESDDGAA